MANSRNMGVLMVVALALGDQTYADTHGVAPERQSLYDPSKDFTCLDGSNTVTFDQVNDNYCDCADGSDEPGTSACPNAVLYCENQGHVAMEIPSYRVNDGVCDCCDASDEPSTGVCSNTCEEAGRAKREADALERLMREKGHSVRLANAAEGASLSVARKEKLAELEPKREQLEAELNTLRDAATAAEQPANDAKAAHDSQWDADIAARREETYRALFALLDTNQNNLIDMDEVRARPEFQSEEEHGATEGHNDDDGNTENEQSEGDDNTDVEVTDGTTEIFDEDGDGVVNETEAVLEYGERFIHNIAESYKESFQGEIPYPDETKPDYPEETKALIAASDAAREARNGMETQFNDVKKEIDSITDKENRDYGDDLAWAPYDGQCFTGEVPEYKYILCPYGEAKQEQKNGGGSTSLGRFKEFAGPEGNKYSKMVFDGGLKCWNGPQRSLTVEVRCGDEPSLTNLAEPSKCEYTGLLRIPAMCDHPNAPIRDEL